MRINLLRFPFRPPDPEFYRIACAGLGYQFESVVRREFRRWMRETQRRGGLEP